MSFEKKLKYILPFILCFCALPGGYAQKYTAKTNLLYWATLSPNIGFEVKVSKRSTIELDGMMNLFKFRNNKKYNFLAVRPEYRYWLCQSFSGHFFGANLLYANYNGGLENRRYNGNLYGGGINYGYQWYLSKHWNIEATVGAGYLYMDHDVYNRPKCGKLLGHETRNYWGITRLGISFIYVIK